MVATKFDSARTLAQARLAAAEDVPAEDVLVFARRGDGFGLVGGMGRGAGWAEIVEVGTEDEPLVERAWRTGMPVRQDAAEPVHVVGPYWARHSAVVPVGHEHLVVFGSTSPINASDAVVVRMAAQSVAKTGDVSAEKLLADELELVHAIRALMAYRAENVRDTARHIALVAARALSCDVGVVQVADGQTEALEVIQFLDLGTVAGSAGPDAAAYLRDASLLADLHVEQTVKPDPRVWQSAVVSRLTVPIGSDAPLGAFALGHSVDRPRGFTLLCQRIARALAESAELLLAQAITREALAAERDLLHQISRTDALTGLANRTGWEEAVATMTATADGGSSYAIVSADLDGLKAVNDRFGHPVGDALIKAAANLLRSATRDGDLVARVGGDEFQVLLPQAGEAGALRVVGRIRRNSRRWLVTEHGLTPRLSVGWSVARAEGVADALDRADRRMYAAKRRRARPPGLPAPSSVSSAERRVGPRGPS
ncbi:MAG: GGDEF domain-containing protein [Candidatus Limnocylindrales bacterium]